VPAESLSCYPGLLHIRDAFGRALTGSPIDPGQWIRSAGVATRMMSGERAAPGTTSARRATGWTPPLLPVWADTPSPLRPAARGRIRRPGLAVVIPVFRGLDVTLGCLERVFATVPSGTQIIVVDDASPEPALSSALDTLARKRRILLLRNARNRGFPASANLGLAAAGTRDAVLLNSDALVPPGWLERLHEAAYAAPDIGTVAPLSNDATILSYPRVDDVQPPPDEAMLDRIDALANQANGAEVVEIPTSVGFCMYIRRACLDETGPFREDVFGQGYGEENDFCLRARHLGWRHMAATGVFVSHIGGQSFRMARDHLLKRNQEILERLHPGYGALIAAHVAADPLAAGRRRLDIARWQALRPAGRSRRSVILITHDEGGGVERQVGVRADALAKEGVVPIILRPTADGTCRVEPGLGKDSRWLDDFPNLAFRLPAEIKDLLRFLRREKPQHIELHHRLGHAPALLDLPDLLGIPFDIHVHDYAAICPRVTLVTTTARYCGEPDAEECAACVADLGSRLREDITVPALRRRSAEEFEAARTVIFSSTEVEKRFRRYLPRFESAIRPWEDAPAPLQPSPRTARPRRNGRWRIGIVGAIGTEKGYDVLLACARDAARRSLPLQFVIIGFTHDDIRLMDTGHVDVTHRFAPERAVQEIAAQTADIGFIPSIWPETWCFALSDAWKAGLKTAVFDIGTQAQRVRETGNGWILPLALPPANVNNMLISLAQSTT
jgi:GT2 family glycosyltransferase/glycosyltransferase involved in cell wall biosynthesis